MQAGAALFASRSWLAWSNASKKLRTMLSLGKLEPRHQPDIIPQGMLGAADNLVELDGRIATSRASAAVEQVDVLHKQLLNSAEMRSFHAADRRLKTRAFENMPEWSEAEKKKLKFEDAVPMDDWSHALHVSMQCDERSQQSVCEQQSVGAEANTPPVVNGGQVSSVSSSNGIDESEKGDSLVSSSRCTGGGLFHGRAICPGSLTYVVIIVRFTIARCLTGHPKRFHGVGSWRQCAAHAGRNTAIGKPNRSTRRARRLHRHLLREQCTPPVVGVIVFLSSIDTAAAILPFVHGGQHPRPIIIRGCAAAQPPPRFVNRVCDQHA